ncbi:MAG: hypothetical protein QS748_14545 [Candidatus Endonucleobacter bathymodioli]|uniref:Uncharacterized protein n=1 Tax=Candidatus Endonucleibacter bathymodioli TaxID=539814 RepID=A0AA90NNZ2_9GAMM|nr:hypothetical protein [Candidatus Endonucleobacter bathymodioli]
MSKIKFISILTVVILIAIYFYGIEEREDSSKKTTAKKIRIYEADYQKWWCEKNHGEREVVLSDGTRSDCVTSDFAIEVDFSKKWAEAIGQSLHYARLTKKNAGILLIVNTSNDKKHHQRLTNTISYYNLPIKVWTINKNELLRINKPNKAN